MIDELNTFEAEFGKMGISKEQKRKRVELAESLLDVFLYAFSWAATQHENGVGDAVIEQELWEMLEEDVLSSIPDEVKHAVSVPEAHIEVSSEDGIDSYIKDQIFVLAASIAATTIAHIAQEYYTSYERAWKAAADESHSIYNYYDEREAILSGKTSKTWNTVLDGRERITHNAADGQTVPIGGVFKVGNSLLRFPLDNSLGADVSEIAGCRCWVTYGNRYAAVQKKSEKDIKENIEQTRVSNNMSGKEILMSRVESGQYPMVLNANKQNRHMPQSDDYKAGASYLTISESEIKELVESLHGNGNIHINDRGNQIKETVEADRIIGYTIDEESGEFFETDRFTIHYSKTGYHIVPTRKTT